MASLTTTIEKIVMAPVNIARQLYSAVSRLLVKWGPEFWMVYSMTIILWDEFLMDPAETWNLGRLILMFPIAALANGTLNRQWG